MVENELCRALRDFISGKVKHLELPKQVKDDGGDEYAEHKTAQVINGYLPPKRSGKIDDIPFIIVRPDSGTTNEEETKVEISIIFGAYSKSDDGFEHCMTMLATVRTALLSLPYGVLDDKYNFDRVVSWQNFPDHLDNYWQVDMKTTWTIRTPQPFNGEY